jgi:hypothetical protein
MKFNSVKYALFVLIFISIAACSFSSSNNNHNNKRRNFVVEQIYFNEDSISVFYDLDSFQTKPTEKQRDKLKTTLEKINQLNEEIYDSLYIDYKRAYPYCIQGATSYPISKKYLEKLCPNPSNIEKIKSMYRLESVYIDKEVDIKGDYYLFAYHQDDEEEHEFVVEIENDKIKYVYING